MTIRKDMWTEARLFNPINHLCTIYVPYAPSSAKSSYTSISLAVNRGNVDINASSDEGLKFDVFRLILENSGCRVPFLIESLAISRATVERAISELIAVGKVEHCGSKKTGGYYAMK